MQLHDLVEFWFDHQARTFIKHQTHMTNKPKAMCYAEKRKIEFLRPISLHTRFKVVKNGELQYSNLFKNKKTKTHNDQNIHLPQS